MFTADGSKRWLVSAGVALALVIGIANMAQAEPEKKGPGPEERRGPDMGRRAEKRPMALQRYGRGMGWAGPGSGARFGAGPGMQRLGPPAGPFCPMAGFGMRGRRLGRGFRAGPGGFGLAGLCMAPGVNVKTKKVDDGVAVIITSENDKVAKLIQHRLSMLEKMREHFAKGPGVPGRGDWAAHRREFGRPEKRLERREKDYGEKKRDVKKEKWDREKKEEWGDEKKHHPRKAERGVARKEKREGAKERHVKKEEHREGKREELREIIRQEIRRVLREMKEHHKEGEK